MQQGRHVCLMAPAGAGKGMVRLGALYQALAAGQQGHALWLVPYKAQALSHRSALAAWNDALDPEHRLSAAIYDGGTPGTERRAIKQAFPRIVLTTPEMLHAGLLAYHSSWRAFWQALRMVVLVDVHMWSGALGSHLAHLLRRLYRIAVHYGSRPQYLLTSAPLDNMPEVARTLTTQACTVVRGTVRRPQPQTRLMFSTTGELADLGVVLLARHHEAGLETLVLAPGSIASRLQTQGGTQVVPYHTPRAAVPVRPYQSLICLGIPPTLSDLHEYLDWLGSGPLPSLSCLVLQGQTPLEQYLYRYPAVYEASWTQSLGLYPSNTPMARWHLHCAAAELALAAGERYGGIHGVGELIQQLADMQAITRHAASGTWVATSPRPHRRGSLRAYEPGVAVVHALDGRFVTRWTPDRAFREGFVGAVSRGERSLWKVERVLEERRRILVQPAQEEYVTHGRVYTTVAERSIAASATHDAWRITYGPGMVTDVLEAYERRDAHTGVCRSVHILPARQRQWATHSVWLSALATSDATLHHTYAAWHMLVHAVLASLPLLLVSEPYPLRGGAYASADGVEAVWHDAHTGGNGTSAWLYHAHTQVLRVALQMLLLCDCTHGCRRCLGGNRCDTCVQDESMQRQAGITLLQRLLGEAAPTFASVSVGETSPLTSAPRHVYLALSTQKSAEEVGGWQHRHLLGLGIAVTYDSADEQVQVYTAETVQALLTSLRAADLVIGFNTRDFDYQVLQPYTDMALATLPTLAVLDEVQQTLGFRLSLKHLVHETLGLERPDDSLQTLQWYQEGDRERIVQQCQRDIALLRALVQHGAETGRLFYRDHAGVRTALPVHWQRRQRNG
jgi:DEAD/DEAH box helicase domain-containing protein